jgi:hypothetical protein
MRFFRAEDRAARLSRRELPRTEPLNFSSRDAARTTGRQQPAKAEVQTSLLRTLLSLLFTPGRWQRPLTVLCFRAPVRAKRALSLFPLRLGMRDKQLTLAPRAWYSGRKFRRFHAFQAELQSAAGRKGPHQAVEEAGKAQTATGIDSPAEGGSSR